MVRRAMSSFAVARDRPDRVPARRPSAWARNYLYKAALADLGCAIVGVFAAALLRFGGHGVPAAYVALSLALPVLWLVTVWLVGGYDFRFIGVGPYEYRKVLIAGVSLTVLAGFLSYVVNLGLSRSYLLIALPGITLMDLISRYALRKRLYRLRASGRCMLGVIAVGHEVAVADLVRELGRERYHGMAVVGACVAHPSERDEIGGVPVYGGLDDVPAAVRSWGADTVAVLACPEMDGIRLRSLAWELEKTGTDLCVSPALLDVAGPRMTVRPVAGLTLMHVDHPRLSGWQLALKDLFDRCAAAVALILLAPLMLAFAVAIRLSDGGPALFKQVRVGRDGRTFTIYKFRTMEVGAKGIGAPVLASSQVKDSFDAEDEFLAGLYPQIAERLAERHAANYDAEAERARFQARLAKPVRHDDVHSRDAPRAVRKVNPGPGIEMPISLDELDLGGVLFKLRKDPRVTPVGARLRRWSIDELPQLFNVLLGDMSLVGPRPATPDEVARYAEHVRRRLVVKPGLTGLWQVNGRSDLSWEESVRLDLRYVENWSFALDMHILWKTISVLIRGPGAY
jgi:exopolysaccharide biosynthesis polyprenyl glycosylphosphotransferase